MKKITLLIVVFMAAVAVLKAQTWNQVNKIVASDWESDDYQSLINVINVSGKTVYSKEVFINQESFNTTLLLKDLMDGNYVLMQRGTGFVSRKRISIQK